MPFRQKIDQLDVVIEAIEERDNLYRTYFNTASIPKEERKSGYADVNPTKS
jgi:hypothetical protein